MDTVNATVNATATPGRLDQFWTENLAARSITRAKVQEWIKTGLAVVDGVVVRKSSCKLRGGEALELAIPETRAGARAEEGGLTVLYSDSALAVVDKPAGLTVHPAPSCPDGTLVNRLLRHFPQLKRIEGERPGIVHRIDKDTSGLLVVALSEAVRLKLAAAFARREVKKTYLALAHGRPAKDQGVIDAPIGRDPSHKTRMKVQKGGREAHSAYKVVWTAPDGGMSLCEVTIATGRTHQIRAHMAHIGHPLVGDGVYGPAQRVELKKKNPVLGKLASRQMLHAWRLAFVHPETGGEMRFEAAVPKDFWRIALLASRRTQRVGVVGLPGSGKSAVMELLALKGHPVWSADQCVAELYQPGRDGWTMLRSRFGGRFTPEDGAPVDKIALFAAMRASEAFRRELMELLYPMVAHRMGMFFAEHCGARVCFAEVPMLLEAGWAGLSAVDKVAGVACPEGIRHERLAADRGWDAQTIALMDSWQWPEKKKLAACDYVVDNSGIRSRTQKDVDGLLAELRGERLEKMRGLLAWMRGQGYA